MLPKWPVWGNLGIKNMQLTEFACKMRFIACASSTFGHRFWQTAGNTAERLMGARIPGRETMSGTSTPVSIYLASVLALMVVAVLAARETSHIDLREVQAGPAALEVTPTRASA